MNACPPIVASMMSQIMEIVLPLLATALTGMLGYATLKFKEWVDAKVGAARQATVNQALAGGLGAAAEKVLRQGGDQTDPSTRREMAASAERYVKAAVPETLAALGPGVDVAKLVDSRMAGKTNVAEQPAAPAVVVATPA